MKQIDIIKTYGQKRCLIVDDNPDVRASLKRILVDFGSTEVETAGHAQEAIELCERYQYDIVLSDYNLGKGKTGQQLLEELRFHGLLKNTALFIMITAESASQHVVHALENQPDDYLSKPINREGLRPRLDASLLKNEALLEVKKALDLKRPRTAIEACQNLINEGGRYQNDAKRMLGELLCQTRQFEHALEVYSNFPEDKRPLWASIGIARANLGLKEYDKSEHLLLDIIEENQYCVDAHDLLAKVYEESHKFDQAQRVIASAIKVSPMSATRQREMGRISSEAGDEHAAAHAYRAAIKHSKNSCQESPEDYTSLANTLTGLMEREPENITTLATEAFETLKQLDKKYQKQPVVNMRSRLIKADIYEVKDNKREAEKANEEALEIFSNLRFSVIEKTSTQLSIDCAKAFMERGKYDEGERLLQEVAKLNNDPELAIQIDKLLREPVTKEGIAYAAKLNKRGIAFHKANQFDDAIASFDKVLSELPNHVGLNLNLIQATLSKSKETTLTEKELSQVASSFQRIGDLRPGSSYKERYDYLQRRFQKLTQ